MRPASTFLIIQLSNSRVRFFTFQALFSPKGLSALSIDDIVQFDETNQFILKVSLFKKFFIFRLISVLQNT